MLATVEDYRPLVLRCTRRLKTDPQTIEDIEQEVMIKIHLYLAQLTEEARSKREDLEKFIGRMVWNLVIDHLRIQKFHLKNVVMGLDVDANYELRSRSSDDQFRDLALKAAAQELIRVLPTYEASILSMLLDPPEEFSQFWRRRQKIREFFGARYGSRYPATEPLDLDDTALPEFLGISAKRFRRAIVKIKQVARMILARERVGYERFTNYLKQNYQFREEPTPMITELVEAKTVARAEPQLECFGIMYDPLVPECKKLCELRFLCKNQVSETIDRIGIDEFQREFVRISGVNAADTSPKVLDVQEIFVKLGLQVAHCAQSVNAKLLGYNVFIISRKKSSQLKGLVRFPQVRALDELPPEVSGHLALGSDGKTWSCTAEDLASLEKVLIAYIKFFREKI